MGNLQPKLVLARSLLIGLHIRNSQQEAMQKHTSKERI